MRHNSFKICYVFADIGGDMVQCANIYCKHGLFHYQCISEADVANISDDDDWYCSDDCRLHQIGYIHCCCHTHKGAEDYEMVQCARAGKCHSMNGTIPLV